MTWGQFRTFLWGSAVVLIDAAVSPIYRRLHRGSKR
jgi:hypothetical protein